MSELNELRKVAEAATPGPWKAEPYLYGSTGEGCRIRVTAPSSDDLHNLADDVLQEDAEFIATFDPPTVLALLSRLEQAEQAVHRVRELAEAWKSRGEHDMEYSKTIPPDIGEIINEGGAEMVHKANLIDRALDGDTRG